MVLDLSDATGDYQVYSAGMIEERVEVRKADIPIIYTGYHRFGWDMPFADEIRSMVQYPGSDRRFAVWAKEKNIDQAPHAVPPPPRFMGYTPGH